MALAKDRISSVQSCAYDGLSYGFNDENHNKLGIDHQEGENGSPSTANSNEFLFQSQSQSQQEDQTHSLINFRGGFESFLHGNGPLLSFTSQKDDAYSSWDHGNLSYNNNSYQWNHMNQKSSTSSSDPRLLEDVNNCFQTASNFNSEKEEKNADWLYSEGIDIVTDHQVQQPPATHKRPHLGESDVQGVKKQWNNASKRPKLKTSPSKDPQSIAAKNRRERISERLKILQELVPNGSKVDLVTMLEKAISYVKFLQLQVKVLATDEFWPVQGGKAPDISQVKEAIDAILSSQKDRNSSSSSK